ncbi:MAG TPA: bifunctional adenosylcobinamide kinase/adenosylcobinamide-phosphate guanylyltransferase [Desulfobacterales bacterium]|nr:bifunctional adenosylcobinamide kinase/adenosylcobinamide-phosphate guanylyltransferase [Desulfobacterales bacterium]
MGTLILVAGGARSGKSDYALARAEAMSGPHCFLATCPVIDGEMEKRIARHKAERAGGIWHTIEEELDPAGIIQSLSADTVCLVDCLTLWINNLLHHAYSMGFSFDEDDMQNEAEALVRQASIFQGTIICVSNEVGMGIVPDNFAARHYRDLVGRCNRIIAAAADEVILVSCGLPLHLKENKNRNKKL